MRALAVTATILVSLWAPTPADANPLCRWTGICLYLSPGFRVTVVDAASGKPLSGVYGWAEWTQYGAHGRGGPLMVQDATSDAAGHLSFPHWGPTFGSAGGLLLGTDPAVILFKPGYITLLVENGVPLGASQHSTIRGFSRSGETLRLQPFRGTPAEWVEQLRQLAHPGLSAFVSDAHLRGFRALYLRRLDLVESQLRQMPANSRDVLRLQSSVELDRRFVTGGRQ
jgi:hypothetical protein